MNLRNHRGPVTMALMKKYYMAQLCGAVGMTVMSVKRCLHGMSSLAAGMP